jgi:hypothetical protein
LEGDFSDKEGFQISDAELVDIPNSIDFGEVSPDFREEDYDE